MKTYTIQQGDTLSVIAGREYGDINLWKIIAEANPSITNPDLIYPGQKITIPDVVDVHAEVIESNAFNPWPLPKWLPWFLLIAAAGGIGYAVHKKNKSKRKTKKK